MSDKIKLAATVLNHFYVIERALDIKRLKRVPSLKDKYAALDNIDNVDSEKIYDIIRDLAFYNNKTFTANIKHLVNNDDIITSLVKRISVSKLRNYVKITISVEPDKGKRLAMLHNALLGPEQDAGLRSLIEKAPQAEYNLDHYRFVINVPCAINRFYKNLRNIESDFVELWNALKTLLSVESFVFEKMSKEDINEVMYGRVYINFVNPRVEKNAFVSDSFVVVETEKARADREIRERLEAALKRRTKKVKNVNITQDGVTYEFEEDFPALRVALDVVTQW